MDDKCGGRVSVHHICNLYHPAALPASFGRPTSTGGLFPASAATRRRRCERRIQPRTVKPRASSRAPGSTRSIETRQAAQDYFTKQSHRGKMDSAPRSDYKERTVPGKRDEAVPLPTRLRRRVAEVGSPAAAVAALAGRGGVGDLLAGDGPREPVPLLRRRAPLNDGRSSVQGRLHRCYIFGRFFCAPSSKAWDTHIDSGVAWSLRRSGFTSRHAGGWYRRFDPAAWRCTEPSARFYAAVAGLAPVFMVGSRPGAARQVWGSLCARAVTRASDFQRRRPRVGARMGLD